MLEEQRPGAAGVPGSAAGPAAEGGVPSAWRDGVTWAIAAAVFGAYLTLSLYRLFTLSPMSWDLGIYTEYVKQYADLKAPVVDVRGAGFNLLGDHFQPIVALIAPFFRLFPSPATLLVAQALLTAVSVFPVVSAGFSVLGPGRGRGRAVGLAYGFSWGLQQMIDFDFHEIAFAVPLLAFSLSALIRGRWRSCALWALPLVFVKEDQGFTVAALGLLLVFGGWRTSCPARRRGGIALVIWGLAASVLAITVIIPHFNPEHHYYYWKDGGAVGSGGPLSPGSLLAQPFDGWAEKLQTSVLLLLPTAFIALGSPVALVTLPSMALRFFSTNTSYWGTMWHYNATVMPLLFLAAVDAMGRARRPSPAAARAPGCGPAGGRPTTGTGAGAWAGAGAGVTDGSGAGARAGTVAARLGVLSRLPGPRGSRRVRAQVLTAAARHGPAMMVAAACVFAFQFPLGSLWHSSTYQTGPHTSAANAAMARVPDGATVQTTLDLLAPLAARTDTFWIGNPGNPATGYVVFDGRSSGYSPAPADVPAFVRQLFPKTAYRQIFSSDDVYVFKRT